MFAELLLNTVEKESDVVCFDDRRCLRNRLNTHKCTLCQSVCKHQAISLSGASIRFDPQHCSGCMLCIASCPNDAFSADINLPNLLKQTIEKKNVVLSCKKTSSNTHHLLLPCLGILPEPLLASMNCLAENFIFLDTSRCQDCRNAHSIITLQKNVQSLMKRLDDKASLKIKFLTEDREQPFTVAHQERRAFFQSIRKSASKYGRETARLLHGAQKAQTPLQSKKPVQNSQVVTTALARLPDHKKNKSDILLSYCFAVHSNDQCNCCPSCAGMCPTGALKRQQVDGVKQLFFTSAYCSGCGLCVDFCKKKALSITKGFQGNPQCASALTVDKVRVS